MYVGWSDIMHLPDFLEAKTRDKRDLKRLEDRDN